GELLQALDLALEAHLHAELAPAVLQDVEQGVARTAAEAVAAGAHHLALVDHVDVAPVGEAPADALVGDEVVGLERIERLVGEHHAEAEGVVGAVALVDRDLPARPGLLREQREVQAAGSSSDDADFHANAPLIFPAPPPWLRSRVLPRARPGRSPAPPPWSDSAGPSARGTRRRLP